MTSFPTDSSDRNQTHLIMVEVLNRFRLPAGSQPRDVCLRCGEPGVIPRARREGLQVCDRCYWRLQLTATATGRKSVEEAIALMVPPKYRSLEFPHFIPYTPELLHAYQTVGTWSIRHAQGEPAGSIYLYSEFKRSGYGCGCGKSMLMYSAFKHIARRRVQFRVPDPANWGPPWDITEINLRAFACDMLEILIAPFLAGYRGRGNGINSALFMGLLGHELCPAETVDEFITLLAYRPPILFLDDVGKGIQPDTAAARLYEDLFDQRDKAGLPVFITTNYSPERLGEIIGPRAASRIIRNDCQILKITAPDFALVKHQLRKPGGGIR